MLAVLFKLLIPLLMIYLAQRWLRRYLALGSSEKRTGTFPRRPPPPRHDEGEVIEICPDCGHVMQRGHRCS